MKKIFAFIDLIGFISWFLIFIIFCLGFEVSNITIGSSLLATSLYFLDELLQSKVH